MQERLAVLLLSITVMAASGSAQKTPIRTIDFKNFAYPWSDPEQPPFVGDSWQWLSGSSGQKVTLDEGRHLFVHPEDSDERQRPHGLLFSSATYGDLDGDGGEEAAVELNYSTGGTMNWSYLYIYKLVGGRPQMLARLRSGSRADGGLVRVAIRDRILVLDFADSQRRMGDCCSEGYIRVRYRWHQGTFTEVAPRERGDLEQKIH